MHGIISNVIKKGFIAGSNQKYKDDFCNVTGKLIGEGIYCTPLFGTAQAYTAPFKLNERSMRLIMMCKVSPTGVKVTSDPDSYWVVNKP